MERTTEKFDNSVQTKNADEFIQDIQVIELNLLIETAVSESKKIVVLTLESVNESSAYIKQFSKLEKRIDEVRKSYTEPLDRRKKEIMESFDKLKVIFSAEKLRLEADTKKWLIRQRENAEKKAQIERKQAEEKALLEAIEKESRLKAEAVQRGKDPDMITVEPAIIPETIIEAPKLSTFNSSGIGTMKVSQWRITNINQVPRGYMMLNESLVTSYRKSRGVDAMSDIPGIEFYFTETLRRG